MSIDKQNIDKYSKMKRSKTWLLSYKKILRLRAIDKELNFPINTVQKFIHGAGLNDERLNKLFNYINRMSKF